MITQVLHCPYCQGIDLVKNGKTPQGIFAINVEKNLVMVEHSMRDYAYPGQSKKIKEQIVDMALNGSGVRDTARVLHVSTSTVIKE